MINLVDKTKLLYSSTDAAPQFFTNLSSLSQNNFEISDNERIGKFNGSVSTPKNSKWYKQLKLH